MVLLDLLQDFPRNKALYFPLQKSYLTDARRVEKIEHGTPKAKIGE